MSAPRPRPVTATIRRPPASGTFRANKNVSLLSDSSGSTESLISCVDDYDSPSDSDSRQTKTTKKNRVDDRDGDVESDTSERHTSKASPITALSLSEPTTTTEEPVTPIGPWEQWMIRKTESMKKLSNQKARLERMRKEQERQQEEEQRQKLLKAERIIQEWNKQKDDEKAKAEKRQSLREKRKQREKERQQQEIEEKAKAKYHEWLEQKKKTDALQHALELEQQKLKELELKEKKEKSDAAFSVWLQKSAQRVRTLPHSYAKCDGAITGYYDKAASPAPTYYNPLPWQPVALPQGQPKPRVKTKGKRRHVIKNAWALDNQ